MPATFISEWRHYNDVSHRRTGLLGGGHLYTLREAWRDAKVYVVLGRT